MRGQRETRRCAGCGKALTRLVSQARGEYWYCDRVCQNAHRPSRRAAGAYTYPISGHKETRPCAICGTPITDYLSARQHTAEWTCSRQCAGKQRMARLQAAGRWQKPPSRPRQGAEKQCAQCGATFYASQAELAKGRDFCSRTCWYRSEAFTQTYAARKARTGRNVDPSTGYVRIRCADGRWRLEHRVIAEQILGRPLAPGEQVHHINRDRADNRPENLEVVEHRAHASLSSLAYHARLKADLARLAEYERRFGPLEPEA